MTFKAKAKSQSAPLIYPPSHPQKTVDSRFKNNYLWPAARTKMSSFDCNFLFITWIKTLVKTTF